MKRRFLAPLVILAVLTIGPVNSHPECPKGACEENKLTEMGIENFLFNPAKSLETKLWLWNNSASPKKTYSVLEGRYLKKILECKSLIESQDFEIALDQVDIWVSGNGENYDITFSYLALLIGGLTENVPEVPENVREAMCKVDTADNKISELTIGENAPLKVD